MCVCVCVYVCVYVYMCVCVCVYVYIYVCVCVCGVKAFNKDKDGGTFGKIWSLGGKFKFLKEMDRPIAGRPNAGTKYQAVELSSKRHFLLLWDIIIIT